MAAQFPQIWTNFILKDAKGLSLGLVIFWSAGDFTNYIGTIYTEQLLTQKLAAISFCLTDILFVFQYFYYIYIYPVLYGYMNGYKHVSSSEEQINFTEEYEENEQERLEDNRESRLSTSLSVGSKVALLSSLPRVNSFPTESIVAMLTPEIVDLYSEYFGYTMAWASVTFYLSSRIPQIIKNQNRRSVHGLSVSMFVLNIIGNGCYGTSVLIRLGKIDQEFFLSTFPYLIGSWGVLIFDCITLIQIHYFKD
jgi:uncharacterized protein with PQ loop repeat